MERWSITMSGVLLGSSAKIRSMLKRSELKAEAADDLEGDYAS